LRPPPPPPKTKIRTERFCFGNVIHPTGTITGSLFEMGIQQVTQKETFFIVVIEFIQSTSSTYMTDMI